MPLMLDHLLANGGPQRGNHDWIDLPMVMRILQTCTAVDVTNIADYAFTGPYGKDFFESESLPCTIPPLSTCWMEYRTPGLARSSKSSAVVNKWRLGSRNGALLFSRDLGPDHADKTETYSSIGMVKSATEKVINKAARFISWGLHFAMFPDGVVSGPFVGTFVWGSQADGKMVGPRDVSTSLWEWMTSSPTPPEWDCNELLFPFWLAISFMHCKNVARAEIAPPPKLSKAFARRHGGHGLLKYYTLNIEPMSQILQTQGRSGEVGPAKALHMCRGHFADYTSGAGLFGKYHGRFWMPQCVKGTAKAGVVVKDYRVLGPRH